MARLDDKGLKPRPDCQNCGQSGASWMVTLLGQKPQKMCAVCTSAFKRVGNPHVRALKASEY
jgi:hypothetical protein